MQLAGFKLLAATLSASCLLAAPATASLGANASGSVEIIRPVGITIVQDILAQTSVSLILTGSRGDAVSLAVPGSIQLSSLSGDFLFLITASPQRTKNVILGQDMVSVSIGATVAGGDASAPFGDYGGMMVVLAQYN